MSSTIDTATAHAALKIVIGKIKDRAPGEPIPWRECEDAVAAAIAVGAAPEEALAPIRKTGAAPGRPRDVSGKGDERLWRSAAQASTKDVRHLGSCIWERLALAVFLARPANPSGPKNASL